jgi:hypothetical protein
MTSNYFSISLSATSPPARSTASLKRDAQDPRSAARIHDNNNGQNRTQMTGL